jgi:pimeloyl-ACP methyl ester carboxylesterase
MPRTQPIYKSPAGEQAMMALYDQVLAHWPVPRETRTLPTRHGDTFVVTSGPAGAPPLVLLHGAGANSTIWAADVARYSRLYRTHAVDLPGEAGRSAPNRLPWPGPAWSEWLEDVLDALAVPNAALLGISQGAWTALKFATHHPERVSKLVLLCPGGIVPDRLSFLLRAVAYSVLGPRRAAGGAERIAQSLFGSEPAPREALEITRLVVTHFNSRVGVLPIFSAEQLRRLDMPALLIAGAQDTLRPTAKIVARMQTLLPQLHAVVLPQAGHVLTGTTRHILPFLAATEQHAAAHVGRYDGFVAWGATGNAAGVDQLMAALAGHADLPTLKLADFALGLVNTRAGSEQVRYYLFAGTERQRNYAALYFKRRGNFGVLANALAQGKIDQQQATAE